MSKTNGKPTTKFSEKRIRERLWSARTDAKLSQNELGDAIGASGQSVSQWEAGRSLPNATNLFALSRALGKSADWLLGLR